MHLTRKAVIAKAMDVIERDGVDAVSMTRLATELGCGLVTLYDLIPSRAALLDGIADAVISGLDIRSAGAGGWQAQIRAQARAFRKVALAHPRCTLVMATRPQSSARMMRPVERALATLGAAGFAGQDAAQVVRAITAYVIGSLLGGVDIAPGLADDSRRLRLRPSEFPHLAALAADTGATERGTPDRDADFEFGLDLLMHAIAARQPARATAS